MIRQKDFGEHLPASYRAGARFPPERQPGSRLRAAAEARGDILFFLHADSRPPDDALAIIRRAGEEGADGGAFSLAYEGSGATMRWIAWWANGRSRLARLPYGDQGIFCRREAYVRSGIPRPHPLRRSRLRPSSAEGRAVRHPPEKTVTSPRRSGNRDRCGRCSASGGWPAGLLRGRAAGDLRRWYEGR